MNLSDTISTLIAQRKEEAIQRIVDRQQAQREAATQVQNQQIQNQVLTAWLAYTGLPPSSNELTQWTGLLSRGASISTLHQRLANEPGYRAYATDPYQLLDVTYDRLFGRDPIAQELARWLPQAADVRLPARIAAEAQGIDAQILNERVNFVQQWLAQNPGENPASVQNQRLIDYLLDGISPLTGQNALWALEAWHNLTNPTEPLRFDQLRGPALQQDVNETLQLVFLAYLRRPANEAELQEGVASEYQQWNDHLRASNGDLRLMLQAMVNNPEFLRPYHNKDLAGSIADLISFLFGRDARPDEIAYWLGRAERDGVWLPWQIAHSATGADRASLNEKLLVSQYLGKVAQRANLDVADPIIKGIVVDLLNLTHVHEGGQSAATTIRSVDEALGKGVKYTPAVIESVNIVGETLSISFDQLIDWGYLDRNHNGVLELGSELVMDVRGRWQVSGTLELWSNNTPGFFDLNETFPIRYALQGAQVLTRPEPSAQLLIRLGSASDLANAPQLRDLSPVRWAEQQGTPYQAVDTNLLSDRVIDQITLIGVRDMGGQIGNIVWTPTA